METASTQGTSSSSPLNRFPNQSGAALFEEQNFRDDNYANGTTREVFDRRNVIDRKNVAEIFMGQRGLRWDTYGECRVCGKECRKRCIICPWIFYCGKEHQLNDWPEHKKNCKIIVWGEDGKARAGKDLPAGMEILEKSTLFVAPRFHTNKEVKRMHEDDLEEMVREGIFRPCFGCHMLIPPYFNRTLVCTVCKFPVHGKACENSSWHIYECNVLKKMCVQDWYLDFGKRRNIMIYLAVLRGVLLKHNQPLLWDRIMSLADSFYLTNEDMKKSIKHFIVDVCQVEFVEEEDVGKFLSIFMKQRLSCCSPCDINKRMVSVICTGLMPFTLVSDQNANVEGGVRGYRMRMFFRTIKPVLKGELLTIGRGEF